MNLIPEIVSSKQQHICIHDLHEQSFMFLYSHSSRLQSFLVTGCVTNKIWGYKFAKEKRNKYN